MLMSPSQTLRSKHYLKHYARLPHRGNQLKEGTKDRRTRTSRTYNHPQLKSDLKRFLNSFVAFSFFILSISFFC